jgi:peptide methionine sulfoxide reductase msrA/msrB
VIYDPSVVSYEQLLEAYWHAVDPTQADGQFVDIGPQYTTAIFTYSKGQQKAAEKSRAALAKSNAYSSQQSLSAGKDIVTPIVPAGTFWPAEKYHQNYYKTHEMRYKFYRSLSGRDLFIQSVWGPQQVYGAAQ